MRHPGRNTKCIGGLLSLALAVSMLWQIFYHQGSETSSRKVKASVQVSPVPLGSSAKTNQVSPAAKVKLEEGYAKLPLSFEANAGQTDKQVKFLARGQGYNLFLTPTEAVLALSKPKADSSNQANSGMKNAVGDSHKLPEQETAVLRMKLRGANSAPQMVGDTPLATKTNYFIGNDPKQWRTDVTSFSKVRYQQVYPGIDLLYYGNQRQLEYDFLVAPGANPAEITLEFEGEEEVFVDAAGELVLSTRGGHVYLQKPQVYQNIDGVRHSITGNYQIKGSNQVGFQVAVYDPSYTLVIDPVLTYSTFFGGNVSDRGFGIAIDNSGNAYVAGETNSSVFPVTNAYQAVKGGPNSDAFVMKLNPVGNTVLYATYLGGSSADRAFGIAVDGSGNSYITGEASSTNFPIVNAIQSGYAGGTDAFVAKLNPNGNSLEFSTFLGGTGYEAGSGIAADQFGNTWVTGTTNSTTGFPLVNAFQGTFGGNFDAFVAKLNPSGTTLMFSTYLGGVNFEQGFAVAVDASGNGYVTGETSSANFPKVNALQTTLGGTDAFVTKVSPTGSALAYSTYLGGSSLDRGVSIAVDSLGNAYVTGETQSSNFPTMNPFQATLSGPVDAFVTKLNPAGSAIIYSTYLGGSNVDRGFGIAVDTSGNTYVIGETQSINFPVQDSLQSTWSGGTDDFVTKLLPTGSSLAYSTYLGGSSFDQAGGIAVDGSGNVLVTGRTSSTDFPTANALQSTLNGSDDAIVARITPTSSCTGVTFANATNFSVGSQVDTLKAADLNQDGTIDLLASLGSQKVLLLVGNGAGGFTSMELFSGILVSDTLIGDFTGDGKIDLVLANRSLNKVTLHAGDGNGGFGTGLSFATGTEPVSLASADFDGDGLPDLAVANRSSGTVSVLMGNGVGGFFAATSVNAAAVPQFVAAADIDHDGIPDLIVIDFSGGISLLKGDGMGGFAALPGVSISAGNNPTSLSLGDFNNDGNVDLAVTFFQSSKVAVYAGNGMGGFASPSLFTVGANPNRVVSGEFNGDGYIDLATANSNGSSISILLGNGSGGFASSVDFATGSNSSVLAAADFNRDGRLDIATGILGNVSLRLGSCLQTPAVQLSASNLTFGSQTVNVTSSPQAVMLSNTGTIPLEITNILASGDFSQTNTCGATLAVGANCTINITFTPTVAGTRTGSVTITDNAPGSPQTVALTELV